MRIELSCSFCGKDRFNYPEKGSDSSIVECSDCGHVVGTMGELKQAVAKAVMTNTRKPNVRRKAPS